MSNKEFKSKMATYRSIGAGLEGMVAEANKDLNFLAPEKELNSLSPEIDDEDDLTKRNLQTFLPINYSKFYKGVRDQGSCGGCWAFAMSGALEGNRSKKLNTIVNYLSPQQLLDCDTNNQGCEGGDMRTSGNYLKAKGVMNDSDYVFSGYTNSCRYNSLKPRTYITGYQYCSNATNYKCSTSIVYTLLTLGPVAVTIDGGSYLFQNYKSGVFTGFCSQVDHAVTLVGYGTLGSQKYWLIRNSWGNYWGENGYIRVAVNSANQNSCFIEYEAVLPLV